MVLHYIDSLILVVEHFSLHLSLSIFSVHYKLGNQPISFLVRFTYKLPGFGFHDVHVMLVVTVRVLAFEQRVFF